tara:strand:+ start:1147 stop:1941 length:795 start_codon:yes stop_codon:yes gene_type:complete
MRVAVAFLTNVPHQQTLDFAKELYKNTIFDVFIVSDSMAKVKPSLYYRTIQISDEDCIRNGFHNSNISDNATHIKKNPIAYDKFLFYFCKMDTRYDFIWVFEDDVFIPKVDSILKLHIKYASDYDLVTPNNWLKANEVLDWHWKSIVNNIEPPYYYSMVCAMGIGRKLLQKISEYVDANKSLFYIESMFNTIAMQNNLKVKDAKELKSIVWMGEWGIDEFILLPDNLFHPKKNIEEHWLYRKQISKAIVQKYRPKKKLPPFLLD